LDLSTADASNEWRLVWLPFKFSPPLERLALPRRVNTGSAEPSRLH